MHSAFQNHLRRALACLEVETPSLHGALARSLAGRSIRIEVDNGSFVLDRARGRWRFGDGPFDVLARASSDVIDALLRGRADLDDAIIDGRVHLAASIDDLLALDTALQLFVQAAVRAPGILDVQRDWDDDLRAGARDESDEP